MSNGSHYLTLAGPCIIVQFKQINQPDATVLQVYYLTSKFNTPPTTNSHQFQLFHDSSRQQYGTYIIHYSIELIAFSTEYTLFNNHNFNLVYRYFLSVKFNSVYYTVTVTR